MSSFQVATGYNQAVSLANAGPVQPRSSGVKYPERVRAVDGTLILKGLPYTEWVWDYLDIADYVALLTACGLSATTPTASAEVTIKTLTSDFTTWVNYNAIANLPDPEVDMDQDRGKVMRIVLRFTSLVAI